MNDGHISQLCLASAQPARILVEFRLGQKVCLSFYNLLSLNSYRVNFLELQKSEWTLPGSHQDKIYTQAEAKTLAHNVFHFFPKLTFYFYFLSPHSPLRICSMNKFKYNFHSWPEFTTVKS
jgi:hypothetical protein